MPSATKRKQKPEAATIDPPVLAKIVSDPAVNRENCRVMMTDKDTGWNFVFGPMTLAAAATHVARLMRRPDVYRAIRIVGDVA